MYSKPMLGHPILKSWTTPPLIKRAETYRTESESEETVKYIHTNASIWVLV